MKETFSIIKLLLLVRPFPGIDMQIEPELVVLASDAPREHVLSTVSMGRPAVVPVKQLWEDWVERTQQGTHVGCSSPQCMMLHYSSALSQVLV